MTDPVINDSSGTEGTSRPAVTTAQPSGAASEPRQRPDTPAPRSDTSAGSAGAATAAKETTAKEDATRVDAGDGSDGPAKPRRRRGSRGGRGRARAANPGDGEGRDRDAADTGTDTGAGVAGARAASGGERGTGAAAGGGDATGVNPARSPRPPRQRKPADGAVAESDDAGRSTAEATPGDGAGRPPKGSGSAGRPRGASAAAEASAPAAAAGGTPDVTPDAIPEAGASGSSTGARRPPGGAGGKADPSRPRRDPARAAGARQGTEARQAADSDGGIDRRPDELPERSFEGKPRSVEAADRAVVRKPRIGDTRPAPEPADLVARDERADPTRAKGRRRRGGRGRGAGSSGAATTGGTTKGRSGGGRGRSGASAKPVEAILTGASVELDDEAFERRRGRSRKGRPVGRYLMTVSVRPQATQIAVLEGRNLIEHYVSRPADDVSQIHGNVYLGRVQNVLPGMEAAFVDIGTPKNAVLYRGDVQYEAEDIEEKGANPRIEQILRAKQTIICQVTKNPIAHKGARLTQEVSLPGRFVVLIPNSSTYGISKRLPDDERKRLRSILDKVKPAQHGLIVRTAAEGVTDSEIQADVVRLLQQWERIEELAKSAPPASLLYREPDMAVRVIREEFNDDYRGVVIDDKDLYEEIHGYVSAISPALADRVQLYDTAVEPLPISERHHVHEQLHKALDRKVWLPSGGSLIIEHTEALTVIDVNTGKNVGTSSLEETVFRNNLEAAVEIAKQLRLRDIGGIIVIDFIDMEIRDNRDEVIKVFRDALARDKTRTQVFDISELGLVEMTRKRIGEGLLESFSTLCPECEGRGVLLDQALLD